MGVQQTINWDRAIVSQAIDDTGLSLRLRQALQALLTLCWPAGKEKPAADWTGSVDTVAAIAGKSMNPVRSALNALVDAGYVKRPAETSKGYTYEIVFSALFPDVEASTHQVEASRYQVEASTQKQEGPSTYVEASCFDDSPAPTFEDESLQGMEFCELVERSLALQAEILRRLGGLHPKTGGLQVEASTLSRKKEEEEEGDSNRNSPSSSSESTSSGGDQVEASTSDLFVDPASIRSPEATETLFASLVRRGLAKPAEEARFLGFIAFANTPDFRKRCRDPSKIGAYVRSYLIKGSWRDQAPAKFIAQAESWMAGRTPT